ncbi:MAG: hypothetical protein U9Q20_05160 [Campylobacterota bacterium]|nr:hypothetical protein [Campylobacterota bacterium]
MYKFLNRRVKSEKGAMDTILVSLMLIVVGIGIVATFASWMSSQINTLKNDANTTINNMISE